MRRHDADLLSVVVDRLNEGGIAVIEAGTGTGKSLAYLLPAARWAQENRRENHPPHEYTMEKFGFSEAQLAEDFREYRERFILARSQAG